MAVTFLNSLTNVNVNVLVYSVPWYCVLLSYYSYYEYYYYRASEFAIGILSSKVAYDVPPLLSPELVLVFEMVLLPVLLLFVRTNSILHKACCVDGDRSVTLFEKKDGEMRREPSPFSVLERQELLCCSL